jgi:hypothetical protein
MNKIKISPDIRRPSSPLNAMPEPNSEAFQLILDAWLQNLARGSLKRARTVDLSLLMVMQGFLVLILAVLVAYY